MKSPAEKAQETRKNRTPGQKAATTKKIKAAAKKIAENVKNTQWESEKVKYLQKLNDKSTNKCCIVCGDIREYVLQIHHADPAKKVKVRLCANCHDTVRRTDFEELKKAFRTSPFRG